MSEAAHEIEMFAFLLLPLLVGTRAGVQGDGIIGGHIVHPHSKPWMVCLLSKKNKDKICGGALIHEKFVMTAAHCLGLGDLVVILGVQNIKKAEKHWQRFETYKLHHFKSKYDTCDNDIVLLELLEPAKLNKLVQLIPLPTGDHEIPNGTKCNVAGWGTTVVDKDQLSDDLMEANVTVESNKICQERMPAHVRMPDTLLCTRDPGKYKGPDEYDSGGPLVCSGVVEGIVCGGINDLVLYTDISKYLKWIKNTLPGSE